MAAEGLEHRPGDLEAPLVPNLIMLIPLSSYKFVMISIDFLLLKLCTKSSRMVICFSATN